MEKNREKRNQRQHNKLHFNISPLPRGARTKQQSGGRRWRWISGIGKRTRTPKRRNTQYTVHGRTCGVESPDRAREMETHDGALGDAIMGKPGRKAGRVETKVEVKGWRTRLPPLDR